MLVRQFFQCWTLVFWTLRTFFGRYPSVIGGTKELGYDLAYFPSNAQSWNIGTRAPLVTVLFIFYLADVGVGLTTGLACWNPWLRSPKLIVPISIHSTMSHVAWPDRLDHATAAGVVSDRRGTSL